MEKDKNSFQKILGATTLFGSVQMFNIFFSVVKTKVVTILIGANGFGVFGLFTSTINLLVTLTSIGIDRSAVKEISELNNKEDKLEVSKIIHVLSRIVWCTGVLGSLLVIFLSKTLSILTFGSDEYSIGFVLLSITILLNQLTNGKKAILQGKHKLKKLAKANFLASLLGLLVSIPMFCFFGINGVIPSIIATFGTTYVVFFYFSVSKKNYTFHFSLKDIYIYGKPMLSLGLAMSFTSILHTLTLWLFQVFIRDSDGLEDVGYYNAGMIIINSYIGIIFTAMSTDYFPRLSTINNDNDLVNELVNKQATIAILLITPIIILFLTFDTLVIRVLYTKEFLIILGFVTFGILGAFFKAVSFSLGYVIIAKGDSKVFIITSVGFNLLMLSICLYSYTSWGLTGFGVGLIIYYFIHLIIIKLITFYRYSITFKKVFYKIFLVSMGLCICGYLGTFINHSIIRYTFMIFVFLISSIFTFREFSKHINIVEELKSKFNRSK